MIRSGAVRSGAVKSGAVRSGDVSSLGSSAHDGISFSASSGLVTIKAPGAAPVTSALTSAFTFTGGNQSYYRAQNGLLVQSVTNTPRVEYDAGGACLGLLMEANRTNGLLQARDFTNASWVKTTMTAAKDQTGADGTANGASSLTATAGNGTALQTIVQAAVNSTLSFDIQRITGTGTIGICQDGVTFTDVTAQINSTGYTRVTLTASQLNPILGIRLGTNGDKIAVDFGQFEAGAFASSRIPTTTVGIARTADSCIRTLASEFSATAGTVVAALRSGGGQDATLAQAAWSIDDTTNNNRICLVRVAGADSYDNRVVTAGALQNTATSFAISNLSALKSSFAWAANDLACSLNGAAVLTDNTASLPTVTTLQLGGIAGASQMNGHIRTFDYYPTRLDNATLQSRST